MATMTLTYNERNMIAQKTIEYLLSLGVFKVEKKPKVSAARKKTLKAIKDTEEMRDVTVCATFEDYLQAIAE